jgi:tetratricopeptide (TPR) repeat protein
VGEAHPALAQSLLNLAEALFAQHRLDEAEPLAREAVALRETTLGAEHVETMSARYFLATLLRERGQYAAATAEFEAILAFDRQRLGPDHPYVGLVLLTLGVTRSRQGDHTAAVALYREARTVLLKTHARSHGAILETINGEGVSLMRSGSPDRAEPLFRDVLTIQRETMGADSWRTGMTESVLGECLWRQGRLDEAERHLLAGYATVRDASGPQPPTLRRLVAFYEDTGRPDDAARYAALLDG